MNFNINQAKVENFKNWFWGRTPINLHQMDDETFSDLPVNVGTEADLPTQGDPDVKYYVADTGDTYRFVDGGYQVVDIYSYGLTQEYRDTPRRIVKRETITDHTYGIPSITAEQVTKGAAPTLATLYNVQALLCDLEQIRRMHVYGTRETLMDVLSKGRSLDKETNVTNWFSTEHALLYRLLASCMRAKDRFNKEVVDALFVHKYVLTWDDAKNRPLFKFNDFAVYL